MQLPGTGHCLPPRWPFQPRVSLLLLPLLTLVFCWFNICALFGIVEYETFTVFLLMIFFNSWPSGKQESIRSRNFLPTLVEMD